MILINQSYFKKATDNLKVWKIRGTTNIRNNLLHSALMFMHLYKSMVNSRSAMKCMVRFDMIRT